MAMTDVEKATRDRDEVLKILQIERTCISRDCDRNCKDCDLVQERDYLLSVYDSAIEIVERSKEGKWIEDEPVMLGDIGFRKIQCSECGWGPAVNINVPLDIWVMNRNFCEKCGAHMQNDFPF